MWAVAVAWAAEPVVPVRLETPIVVDGVLDEPAWQGPGITGLVEMLPVPGQPDRGTVAWLAYDDDALYVAFHAQVDPERRQSNALSARDRNRAEDTVGILLDTFRDGRRAFLFMVNGRGIQGDGIFVDGESDLAFPDLSWDGVFDAAGTFTAGEYQVEMAIPFRSLRFPPGVEQTWNVLLVQHVPVPSADFTWPVIDPNAAGVLVQAAQLGPFPVERRPGRVELLPTVAGFLDVGGAPLEGKVDPGIAARVALTTGLSAELTLNPDFSQIESDVGQVSATAKFPLFFPERRPFFLENADLFGTPLNLVHTRSIVDPLVGYKVTGRTGALGLGFVGGYDEHPAPSTISVDYASGEPLPTWDEGLVEDAVAVDHVARVRGDLGGGNSIGVIASDKELLTADGRFANRVFGADAVVTTGRYQVATQLLGAMTDFPGDLGVVSPAWSARVGRQGESWQFELGHGFVGREFRAENGFLTEAGRMSFDAGTRWLLRPGGAVRQFAPGVDGAVSIAPDGAIATANAGGSIDTNLGSRWYLYTESGYARERFAATDFDLAYERGNVFVMLGSAWFLGVDWSVGTLPHYSAPSPADLYRGFDWQLAPSTNFDAFGRLNVSLQTVIDVFGPSAFGEPEYVTLIPRGSASLALSPQVQARLIAQYDSFTESSQADLLLAYVVNYGTVGYLGFTAGPPGPGDDRPLRVVFAKLSYLARL
ncbi:MAG: DUF5916 domain-containing protein [Myxococcota bacterium]